MTDVILIVAAVSGWATFVYNWLSSSPSIRGQIMNVIIGSMAHPEKRGQWLTAFNVYVYLTNRRRNSIHILDYELEVDRGSGYVQVQRVWGANTIPNWPFDSEAHKIEIPDYPKKLIYTGAKPLEHGIPLHGWLLFASEEPQANFNDRVKRYRLTCVDAFQKRHKIVSPGSGKSPNLYLWEDLAGVRLTPKNHHEGDRGSRSTHSTSPPAP